MGVDTKLVEDGGLEVGDVDGVFGDVVADVVGGSVGSGLDAAASHPHGEGVGVMVSAVVALFEFGADVVLHHGCAAKFATPDDEGAVEESTLFEIGNEASDGLVNLAAFDG